MAAKSAYARAGVDIHLGNQVKKGLPALLASTHRREVLGKVGGFGGLFALDTRRYPKPVLVSSVDGVGTKLKVAFELGIHHTIGQDLVNHCANDIAVIGAEPLFFLDYLGTGLLKPKVFEKIIEGFAIACAENRCALIGGETAQMPGFYQEGEYDLSGTIVGVVEKERMMSGKTVRKGDLVIGLAGNGLHTNGYSLARKVLLEEGKLKLKDRISELGCTLGEELLKIHPSYALLIGKMLRRFNKPGEKPAIKALAHITGGGFIDNINRQLPAKFDVFINQKAWTIPPIFHLIREMGRIKEQEMFHVFNMGIGMTVIVDPVCAPKVLKWIGNQKQPVSVLGEVGSGTGKVWVDSP